MDKPRVKMLLWVENPDKGEGGELAHGVGDLAYHAMGDGWSLHRRMNWHDAPNIEAAKAAAQVDYEARILAALEPVTVQEAARVLLGQWLSGSFEDTADAIADDAIISQWAHVDRTYPDANPIIESWLRALAEKGT